jgi:predicted enzyme related to lactoylglutathione lyase
VELNLPRTGKENVMDQGLGTIIVPVKDLAAGKALYTALLGTAPPIDQPYYVAFEAAGRHLGLDPNGHAAGMTGPVAFWPVADIGAAIAALVAAGASVRQEPREVGGGRQVATVVDSDGNPIGLMQDRQA